MIPVYDYQEKLYRETRDLPFYGVLWAPRRGKNRPTIRTAWHLYRTGKIDAVVVVAPNGVHYNWSRVAIPYERENSEASMYPVDEKVLEWHSDRTEDSAYISVFQDSLTCKEMVWVCANVEALVSRKMTNYLNKLFAKKRVLFICDESQKFKSYHAKRAIRARSFAKKAPYRRVLTGTVITKSPFDLWSQMEILDHSILNQKYSDFKLTYGVYDEKKSRFGRGESFHKLLGYKDLDRAFKIIEPYCSVMEEPPRPGDHYVKRFFELTPIQRKAMNAMKKELTIEIESGVRITELQAMTRLMRLQQISRGFIMKEGVAYDLGGPKPCADLLVERVAEHEGKVVVWCRFTEDIQTAMNYLTAAGIKAVRYDGKVSAEYRYQSLQAFQEDPTVKVIVGTPATGASGRNMAAGTKMIFYSHDFNFEDRKQAIARIKGPDQTCDSLVYEDLVGVDTPDLKCLAIHDSKQALLELITGRGLLETLG